MSIARSQKLYVLTRNDLSPGQQAAQLLHAQREFTEQYPEEDRKWYRESNTIVLLAAKDENHLRRLVEKAGRLNINLAAFYEPDLNNALTAVAFGPCENTASLCRGLPLALRDVMMVRGTKSPECPPSSIVERKTLNFQVPGAGPGEGAKPSFFTKVRQFVFG